MGVFLGREGISMPEFPASKGRLPSCYLLLAFFSLTAGIVTAAFLYYRNYEKHYRVDEALYQAKTGGRNRVAYAIQAGLGSLTT